MNETIQLPPSRGTTAPDELAGLEILSESKGNNARASWNFSLDQIRIGIARYSPEAKQLLVAAFRWCIDPAHQLSKPEFARRVNSADNTIYKIFTGQYRHPITKEQMGPSDELLKNIRKFLEREGEIFVCVEKEFVLTPTAKKIVTACDLARESRSIVFLVGPSHIGKTWTLDRHYRPTHNHGSTIYSRMRAASGLCGMVRQMADDIDITGKSNTAALIDRIKNALAPEMLLILDEVHLLAHTYRKGSFHNCMEVIREIHDRSKCGMVLCFTLLDAVRAANQKELQQLWRRGVHKVFLPEMPTKKDVSMILAHHGLNFPEPKFSVEIQNGTRSIDEEPYAILKQVCKAEALKAVTERIRYGKKLASKAHAKFTWEHFITAHLMIAKNAENEGDWDAV